MIRKMEKAISDIVRTYLQQETEIGRNLIPKAAVSHPINNRNSNKNGKAEKPSSDSEEQVQLEQEFVLALYQCLEEKGVMKEVQAFIRQRLVQILKGAWPTLVQAACDGPDVDGPLHLIQDFLCTHKLLFTFSVFSSELVNDQFKFRDDFGKMGAHAAENLLVTLNIPKDSVKSRRILKAYFDKYHLSLLEAIVNTGSWKPAPEDEKEEEEKKSIRRLRRTDKEFRFQEADDDGLTLEDKLRAVDEDFEKQKEALLEVIKNNKNSTTDKPPSMWGRFTADSLADQRLFDMLKELDEDKERQIKVRIQKFKDEEVQNIREEIETKLKFEFLQKEKQLLSDYEEKMAHMQNCFEREKEIWFLDKFRDEQQRREIELGCFGVPGYTTSADRPVTSGAATGMEAGDFLKTSSSRTGVRPDTFLTFEEIDDSTDFSKKYATISGGLAGLGKKRELERNYLLKEASWRNTIEKLELENRSLKSKKTPTTIGARATSVGISSSESSEAKVVRYSKVTTPKAKATVKAPAHPHQVSQLSASSENVAAGDARAFLQYTVECQAEQIEKLQQAIQQLNEPNASKAPANNLPFDQNPILHSSLDATQNPNPLEGSLEQFLAESKRRCSEIEQETQFVKDKMNQLSAFSTNLAKLNTRQSSNRIPIPVPPKLPPSLRRPLKNRNLSSSAAGQLNSLNLSASTQKPHVAFTMPSFFDNLPTREVPTLDSSTADSSSASVAPAPAPTATTAAPIVIVEENGGNADYMSSQVAKISASVPGPEAANNEAIRVPQNSEIKKSAVGHDDRNPPETIPIPRKLSIGDNRGGKPGSTSNNGVHNGGKAQSSPTISKPLSGLDPTLAFSSGALIRDKIPSSSDEEHSRHSGNRSKGRNVTKVQAPPLPGLPGNNNLIVGTSTKSAGTPEVTTQVDEHSNAEKTKNTSATPSTSQAIIPVGSFQKRQEPPPKSLALSFLDDLLEMETGKADAADGEDEDDLLW